MKFFLAASSSLRSCLEVLIPNSPHQFDVLYLSEQSLDDPDLIQKHISGASGYDAILLADGAGFVSENGLQAGEIPLVIPRVHNCISLLLGGSDAYRNLFARFNGELCWALPEAGSELCFIPRGDCTCLCYLADTELNLNDASLGARAIAQKNGWDYFQVENDLSLLNRLLTGDWEHDDILIVPKNQSVFPTYRYDILA